MKLFKFKNKMNKKGQVFDGLSQLAVGIATLTILLIVAFLIMSQGKEQVVDSLPESTFVNNTLTIDVDQFISLPCITTQGLTVISAYNGTTEPVGVILAANYTVSNHRINFSDDNMADTTLPATINVTFSCKQPDMSYNGTSTLQDATSDIPEWMPLIVVAVIGVLLLSLVALFRRRD